MAGFMPDFDKLWDDEALRDKLMQSLRLMESDPTMLGATGHILAVGRKG
jgi:hypothetical protein